MSNEQETKDVTKIDHLVEQMENDLAEEEIEIAEQADIDFFEEGSDLSSIFSNALEGISSSEEEEKIEEPKEKKSIVQRVFDNVVIEETEEQKQEREKKEKKIQEKQQKAKENKEAKRKQREQKKEEKKQQKEQKKKEAAIKKQQKIKEKQEAAQEEENQPKERLNRIGLTIVFTFTALVFVFLIAGTDLFSYQRAIHKANTYFEEQKYRLAYQELLGVKMRAKDQELYDQIETIMFVHQEWRTYQNLKKRNAHAQALDTLLKGLRNYDKYQERAITLGVDADLKEEKNKIVQALQQTYQLSEQNARDLLACTDREQYSRKIYEIVAKH